LRSRDVKILRLRSLPTLLEFIVSQNDSEIEDTREPNPKRPKKKKKMMMMMMMINKSNPKDLDSLTAST
jgi:hypothetical protein